MMACEGKQWLIFFVILLIGKFLKFLSQNGNNLIFDFKVYLFTFCTVLNTVKQLISMKI